MKKRAVLYFSRNKALKILEHPLKADLKTFLSATLAISRSRIVKRDIRETLMQLDGSNFKLSA